MTLWEIFLDDNEREKILSCSQGKFVYWMGKFPLVIIWETAFSGPLHRLHQTSYVRNKHSLYLSWWISKNLGLRFCILNCATDLVTVHFTRQYSYCVWVHLIDVIYVIWHWIYHQIYPTVWNKITMDYYYYLLVVVVVSGYMSVYCYFVIVILYLTSC